MVMKKLLLNKVKTETKNWVRSARLHSALMPPDVRLGVWNSRGPRRELQMLDSSRRCGSTAGGRGLEGAPQGRGNFPGKLGLRGWRKSEQAGVAEASGPVTAVLKVGSFVGSL
jgi:hypothetical protein